MCCGSKWQWFNVEMIEECEGLLPRFFVRASVCVGVTKSRLGGFGALEKVAAIDVFVECVACAAWLHNGA
jgi:hypothetical protein